MLALFQPPHLLQTEDIMQKTTQDTPIRTIPFEDEFRICPLCGYVDGFHTMLLREGQTIKWLFICPSCHQRFDIGRTVSDPI